MKIEIEAKFIKDVLEAIDESKKIDTLFELKNEYNRILKRDIVSPSDNIDFKSAAPKPCPVCKGEGRILEKRTLRNIWITCLDCEGKGFIKS